MSPHGVVAARVQMLDNSIHVYDIKMKSYGNVLLQAVMKELGLLEADYFGLQHRDEEGNEIFLDPLKKIEHQIPNINNVILKFVVKFFPPDPGQLQEEYTRYLFALQIKQDLAQGILPCSVKTLVVLASYIAQSEFGDWEPTDCSDLSYLEDLQILPPRSLSTNDLLMKISERHKTMTGETPDKADLHLLDIARRLDGYGVRLHPARDQEDTEIKLAVAHMGVLVYRGGLKINTFNWARVRKLSFKKNRFLIKLKTEAFVDNQVKTVGGILEFFMASRDACKIFWKHCIECHAFFRLEVRPPPQPHAVILKRGSTFRYSGKTQKQLTEIVRNSHMRRTAFTRSFRRADRHTDSWPTPLQTPALSAGAVNGGKVTSINHARIPNRTELQVYQRDHRNISVRLNGLDSSLSRHPAAQSDLSSTSLHAEARTLAGSNAVDHERSKPSIKPGKLHKYHDNSVSTKQPTGPDILNHVGGTISALNSALEDSNDGPGARSATSYLSDNILSIESVSSSSKSSTSSVARSISNSSRRSCNQPLPPPPPPPQEVNSLPSFVSDFKKKANLDLPSLFQPQEDCGNSGPPPLPPKLSTPVVGRSSFLPQETAQTFTVNEPDPEIPFIESSNFALNEIKPGVRGVQLRDHDKVSLLSASEISIPSLAAGESRTPSQYEMLEQKMIKAGFYSVPKKPPIPPTSKCNKVELDSDVNQALNELDLATMNAAYQSAGSSDDRESITNGSQNGRCGIVDSEGDMGSSTNEFSFNQLLTPIPMEFDDHYTGPGSNDVLSSFAMEMEASFDRIKQSLSSDQLDKDRNKVLPIRRPFANSTGVLVKDEKNYISNSISSKPQLNEPSNRKVNTNVNGSNRFEPRRRIIRRESDEIVDL